MVVVDAERRTPLMNPALSALQPLRHVNRSTRPLLLIGRHGIESLIDDSATIIQDERGAPAGAVLVFRPSAD